MNKDGCIYDRENDFDTKELFVRYYSISCFDYRIMFIYHYNVFIMGWNNEFMFPCGYRLCELYFIVSGFFLAIIIESNKYTKTISYIKSKLLTLYPQYLISLLLSFLFHPFVHSFSLSLKNIISFIQEVLLIQEWGGKGNRINDMTWFLSALLLVEILLFFIRKHIVKERTYFLVSLECSVIILLIFCMYNFHNLHFEGIWHHISIGAIRAWISVSIGIVTYYIKDKIQYKKTLLVVGIVSIVVLCYIQRNTFVDYLMIPASVAVIIGTESHFSKNV